MDQPPRLLVRDERTVDALRKIDKQLVRFNKTWESWSSQFTFIADQLLVVFAAKEAVSEKEADHL